MFRCFRLPFLRIRNKQGIAEGVGRILKKHFLQAVQKCAGCKARAIMRNEANFSVRRSDK